MALQSLAKACIADDQWMVVEGEVSTCAPDGLPWGGEEQPPRHRSTTGSGKWGGAFNTPFPRINRNDFPPGRGLLVGSGRAALVQVARTVRAGSSAHSGSLRWPLVFWSTGCRIGKYDQPRSNRKDIRKRRMTMALWEWTPTWHRPS